MSKTRRPRRVWKVILGLLLALIILLGGAAVYVWNGLQPAPAGKPVKFAIPAGIGTLGVAETLEKNGIIRNKDLFAVYLKYKKQGSRFQAGDYEMTPGLGLDEIIAKLNSGETVKEETLRFTVPEGYTLKQIADKLAEQKAVNADEFLKLADQPAGMADVLAGALPADPKIKHALEGYLFPETYEMKKGSTGLDILKRMAAEEKKKLDAIPDFQNRLKARGLTVHQLLTVASLVEKEAAVEQERPLIAGVIYNRLQAGKRLEIDATVQYALPVYKERLMEADLKTESPYNTYLHDGLPPGPIASPGLSSIEAALSPQPSKYMFYVTKKDGSRTHLFAETYQQHLKNIELSKKFAK
jgi:UPF0755 protein